MNIKLKRSIALLLTCLVLCSLIGCNNSSNQKKENAETGSTSVEPENVSESEDDTKAAVDVKTVSGGSVEMDYMVFGKGENKFVIIPGLSVHSVMGLADSVAEAYKNFSDNYTVYLFDRPKELKDDITIRELAEDTAAAMKALNIENAYVFGASQGGMIAQYLAIDHPELVCKMVLGSTLSKMNDTFEKVGNKWIQLAENRDEKGLIEAFVDDVYSKNTLELYRDTLISSNLGITEDEYERFIKLAKSCLTFDCYNELSAIQCPVLVIGCEGDNVVTAEASKEIAKALNCEIYLYDDSYGHGVYDEAADYKQRCMDFFEEANSL